MKKEVHIGSLTLTATLEDGDGHIEIVDNQTQEHKVFLHINESYFTLLFTVAKLAAFEIKQNEPDARLSSIVNRIHGAEEMLLNTLEVLKARPEVFASIIPTLILQLEKEYKDVYKEVYSGDIPQELFKND